MSQTGKPKHGEELKRNAGHALTGEVLKAIDELPQVKSKEWSESYLSEQLWRNFLGLPADYNWADLQAISAKNIVE